MTFKLKLNQYNTNYYELTYPEAAYSRRKTIGTPGIGVCDVCGQENVSAVTFDSSDGEYGDIIVCRDCLLLLAKKCEEAK